MVRATEVMLIGDFNLHYPRWGGERVRSANRAAHGLLRVMENRGLSLATPVGAITWRNAGSAGMIIDLALLTEGLHDRLVRCAPRDLPEEVEDYTAIKTVIEGDDPRRERKR